MDQPASAGQGRETNFCWLPKLMSEAGRYNLLQADKVG